MGAKSWLDRVFRGEAVSDAEYGARETAAGGLYEAAEEPADAMEVFARHAAAAERPSRRDNLVEFSRTKASSSEPFDTKEAGASGRQASSAKEFAGFGFGGSGPSGSGGSSYGGGAGDSADAYVVFKRLKDFTMASHVADRMTESKIVILNLESCDDEIARRVLDFIGGVAYACGSMVKRIAGRVFMITPKGVSSDGEFFDEAREASAIRYDD